LDKLEISQTELAVALGTTFRTVNEIVNEKRNISAEMAIKLSRYFSTDVDFWLNLQNKYDVQKIYLKKKKNIEKVKPFLKINTE
jgi:addiction module HigA family antidote